MRFASLVVLFAAATGCGSEETGTSVSAIITCDDINCPGNSDILGALGPYELSMNPTDVSSRGFSFDRSKVTMGGDPVRQFRVEGAGLRGMWHGQPVQRAQLIGAQIPIHHKDGNNYVLSINGYEPGIAYDGSATPAIDAFYIVYQDLQTGERHDLCPYQDYDDSHPEQVGTWAVFWKGDRYDPETGVITASDDKVGPWFNLSCAGEATIKMLRAKTGGAVAPDTTWKMRQATLNMFTAKYCPGSSHRYTHLGVALDWNDKTGSNHIDGFVSREALWNEHGAVCLDTMRAPEEGPIACKLDPCTKDQIVNWNTHGELLSVNPPPAP